MRLTFARRAVGGSHLTVGCPRRTSALRLLRPAAVTLLQAMTRKCVSAGLRTAPFAHVIRAQRRSGVGNVRLLQSKLTVRVLRLTRGAPAPSKAYLAIMATPAKAARGVFAERIFGFHFRLPVAGNDEGCREASIFPVGFRVWRRSLWGQSKCKRQPSLDPGIRWIIKRGLEHEDSWHWGLVV